MGQYTQEFFMAKHGRCFERGEIQMPEAPDATVRQIPPYNGFGNEEDTLGYIYDLIPKKPKGDFFKSVDNDKKILRYTARFSAATSTRTWTRTTSGLPQQTWELVPMSRSTDTPTTWSAATTTPRSTCNRTWTEYQPCPSQPSTRQHCTPCSELQFIKKEV